MLTFDDGPWPGTTSRVLDALKRECARATFFLLGRNAAAHPALARRELAEGHTVAHHTFAHPLLNHMRVGAAEAEIDRGIAAVEMALYGQAHRVPRTPFFRFPGFASSPALLDRLAARGMTVFGADFWASDWLPMRPAEELRLTLARLDAQRRRHRSLPRHQGADRGHAAGVPARAEDARLSRRARRPRWRSAHVESPVIPDVRRRSAADPDPSLPATTANA